MQIWIFKDWFCGILRFVGFMITGQSFENLLDSWSMIRIEPFEVKIRFVIPELNL